MKCRDDMLKNFSHMRGVVRYGNQILQYLIAAETVKLLQRRLRTNELRFSPKATDHCSHASAKQRRSHLNSGLGKVNFDGHFLSGENVRVSGLLEQRFEYVELWSTERCSLSPLLSRASCSFSNTCSLRKSDDLLYFTFIFGNYFKMLTILAEENVTSNTTNSDSS